LRDNFMWCGSDHLCLVQSSHSLSTAHTVQNFAPFHCGHGSLFFLCPKPTGPLINNTKKEITHTPTCLASQEWNLCVWVAYLAPSQRLSTTFSQTSSWAQYPACAVVCVCVWEQSPCVVLSAPQVDWPKHKSSGNFWAN
jgi:hypothetical protein